MTGEKLNRVCAGEGGEEVEMVIAEFQRIRSVFCKVSSDNKFDHPNSLATKMVTFSKCHLCVKTIGYICLTVLNVLQSLT